MVAAFAHTTTASIKALKNEIAGADDAQILRIVAAVDAMADRGPADALIAPLRKRLSVLRPPRPLRLGRLLFHPLDPLIVPAPRWRPTDDTIPRTALSPMADHVRQAMSDQIFAIERQMAGHTDADADLLARLGRSLWPAAASILRAGATPANWDTSGLAPALYPPLAAKIAALLDQAPPLDAICIQTANGLLPVDPEAVGSMLDHLAADTPAALPMMITVLLHRLPEATASVLSLATGARSASIKAATDQAIDVMLQQINLDGGADDLIGTGTLAEAGATASNIKTLLNQLDETQAKPQRREQLHALRQRLDTRCKARFAAGLETELLIPLRALADEPDQAAIGTLETAARNLRILELEARTIGSSATYDLLLNQAADLIKGTAGNGLAAADQVRLVEFLAGPDAALAMLRSSPG